ncbi:MAG: DNA repair protein RecN [Oscillospiraceae bacterium]|nr:DNA repair protein RecN [Oscillospiraceae bacterium]
MLELLHIENIAVIEQADITFRPGFNALTGETGAGKSIVIDAISAILGQRAYRDSIRTGAKRAFISAVFRDVPEYPWFGENGVTVESGEVMIQREIYTDGRNVCRVNGIPVTVTSLRGLGQQLIQIHGQHDSQQLMDEANHLGMLDAFADHGALLEEYRTAFLEMDEIRRKIRSLHMDEAEKARRIETLNFQIQEITRAELKPGEDQELEEKRKLMRSGENLMTALNTAVDALYGNGEQEGAKNLISQAHYSFGAVAGLLPQAEETLKQLEELTYSVMDAAERVMDLRDSLDFSPRELEAVESRLDVIHRLRRKYGATVDDILDYCEQCRTELEQIQLSDDTIAKLQLQFREKAKRAKELAARLTESRKKAAEEMQIRLVSELRQLDMPRVRFQVQLTPLKHLEESGGDGCVFLMSANVGEELRQMNRVASGGEFARIMLAMKNVLSEKDHIPTLIFDEVDTGVSGRAAQKVAEKLSSVSRGKQVLCVTHLPQIAAMADTHFLISKGERDGRTYTSVTPLELEGRKAELARLIGGARITENTMKSAEEMLRR